MSQALGQLKIRWVAKTYTELNRYEQRCVVYDANIIAVSNLITSQD